MTIGWIVKVTTTNRVKGERDVMFYAAGFAVSTDAEDAVRQTRGVPGEEYVAVDVIDEAQAARRSLGPNEVQEASQPRA
jgi:hypothetical protein